MGSLGGLRHYLDIDTSGLFVFERPFQFKDFGVVYSLL